MLAAIGGSSPPPQRGYLLHIVLLLVLVDKLQCVLEGVDDIVEGTGDARVLQHRHVGLAHAEHLHEPTNLTHGALKKT